MSRARLRSQQIYDDNFPLQFHRATMRSRRLSPTNTICLESLLFLSTSPQLHSLQNSTTCSHLISTKILLQEHRFEPTDADTHFHPQTTHKNQNTTKSIHANERTKDASRGMGVHRGAISLNGITNHGMVPCRLARPSRPCICGP